MKNLISFVACCIIGLTMLQYRIANSEAGGGRPVKVTEWDAFGYYMYLPSTLIYHDYKKLDWLPAVDRKYAVTGGDGWQAIKERNGNYVFKYLGGVALLELPAFLVGDFIAKHSKYPADGFSPPYQYALSFGVLLYCLLAVFLLRKILLRYFKDLTVAVSLLLLCLATNFIFYASIDNGQSHAYIFPLYALVLYTTIKWHERPRAVWALLTGYLIGLATICRPTEAIMLFIPLMWQTQNREAAKEKWLLVKQHKIHLVLAALGGIAGILPQLIYWKVTSGSFIYDVGSRWDFLNPHFRVLFGWEKGWFIYTPVTLCFITGLFLIKRFPFRKSVLWFCVLNIWIIIAWHEWRYGGSYSTRALVQSYPVFALPFAALVDRITERKWKWLCYAAGAYLVAVNLFQVQQYIRGIIHYDDMNRRYYGAVYLDPHPSPLDMSLLDMDEMIGNESAYHKTPIAAKEGSTREHFAANDKGNRLFDSVIETTPGKDCWLRTEMAIRAPGHLWLSYIEADLKTGDSVKHYRVRLFNGISKDSVLNHYAFYVHMPEKAGNSRFSVYLSSAYDFEGSVEQIKVTELER